MPKPPINFRKIRSLAGDVWFARGEAYFKAGRVFELNVHNSKLSARVTGTSDYRVSMRIENDDLIFSRGLALWGFIRLSQNIRNLVR